LIGFVHIPKTAGSTLKFVLRNTFCLRHCDLRPVGGRTRTTPRDIAVARLLYPGLRSVSGHTLIHPTKTLAGIRFFTFLRDPVSRVASAYAHHVRGGRRRRLGKPERTLEEFLSRHQPGGNQTYQIAGSDDVERAKRILEKRYFFVGLTERFDESLAVLAALSPYPLDTRYQRRNTAPVDDPVKRRVLEDRGLRSLVEEANRSDRALYDWVASTVYPAQLERARRAAGASLGIAGETDVGMLRFDVCRAYNKGVFRTMQKALDAVGRLQHRVRFRRTA
jgi:hypothetical protein